MAITPIITTLAEYQTEFWLPVGLELRARGTSARFLSFDSRSHEMLLAAGLDSVDATASAARIALGTRDPQEVAHAFGMDRLGYWLTHEKFAFGTRDTDQLLRKLAGTLLIADRAIESSQAQGDTAMVQELGGFLSVIGSHFAALHRAIPSWFIEPSFFRGRLLFLEGSVAAKKLPADLGAPVEGPVADYLADTLEKSAIVIPEKDRHQYTSAFRKVATRRNLARLGQKMIDKHIFGKEQEFGHIGSHVSTHAKMIWASRKLASHYTDLQKLGRFVYYPLHVPGDMALTLRSPEYLDQVALVDYLCRVAPPDVTIAIKEHPAMIGAMGAEPLLRLKKRYDRLRIIAPSVNNYDVLKKAAAIVTVNSKSGAEAGLLGKPVLVLGDAFYANAPFATAIPTLSFLGAALSRVLVEGDPSTRVQATRAYYAGLWRETLPGELYVSKAGRIVEFTDSLTTAINNPGWAQAPAGAPATRRFDT